MNVILLFSLYFFAVTLNATQAYERKDSAYQLNINLVGSLQNPAFSPDGKSILLTRFRNGYNVGPADLFIFDLKNGTLKKLVYDGFDNINLPGSVWNQKKSSIVFSSSRGAHDEIYTVRADATSSNGIQVTERDNFAAYEPTFSPDGEMIVFESHPVEVEDHGVITIFDLEGSSGYCALTIDSEDARQPNWSPKGDKILYQKYLNDQWDIWTMNIDGGKQKQVTLGEGDKTDASFSQDSDHIIYSFETDSSLANIYILDLHNGDIEQITDSSGYDGAPSVSMDGSKVVFESSPEEPDNSSGTSIWILETSISSPALPGIILYLLQ
jgi:TolB protein